MMQTFIKLKLTSTSHSPSTHKTDLKKG
uniref:Uncharacterized protein n=1 Tax=Anguilla anguilla TaxID=7936 RepID=A0A0E9PHM5_ANGAN